MNTDEIDVTNCDLELIHLPGQIQDHGFLIVLDHNLIIRYASDNLPQFLLGASNYLINEPLAKLELLIKNKKQPEFILQLIKFGEADENFYQKNPFCLDVSGIPFHLIISKSGPLLLLEFEPAASDEHVDIQSNVASSIIAMLGDKNITTLVNNAAIQVKKNIKYDRVMVYRFADDGHGEVVAEAKNEGLQTWLGLHYPASDIPKQARELYKLNLTRLIADVDAEHAKIITSANNPQPLNLTYSQLRAVSPIHIQYLKNMEVASSFSISLLYKGELWGLIACHNYTPRFLDYKSRESAKLIGQILSSALEFMEKEQNVELQRLFDERLIQLNHYLLKNNSIEYAITGEGVTLLDITAASGAVLLFENKLTTIGTTPNSAALEEVIEWAHSNITDLTWQTTNLSALYPPAAAFKDVASGMLLFTISKQLKEYVIWFKPEVLQTVSWAGNPNKLVTTDDTGIKRLSPRHSFEKWIQNVTGTSLPWMPEEIKAVTRLKDELLYAINIKANAIRLLNDKLQEAYEELDTFSYTISHDLKSPIAAIKGYSDLMLLKPELETDMQKALRRIGERAGKMNSMVNDILDYTHLTRLEIQYKDLNAGAMIEDIITDLDLDDFKRKIKITLGPLPKLYGDKVMIMQVFSNLISNAVKYSVNEESARIHIEGRVKEKEVIYSIKDNGIGIAPENMTLIFGLFKRMDNVHKIDGSGVGLAIVKRIVEKHNGKIWVESELGSGSVFYVSFKKGILIA